MTKQETPDNEFKQSEREIKNTSIVRNIILNPLKELSIIIKDILNLLDSDKGYEIIKRRYGLQGSKVYSIAEIASFYQMERTALYHYENKLIQSLANKLLSVDAQTLISKELIKLRSSFLDGEKIVTHKEVVKHVELLFNVQCDESDAKVIRLLLNAFEFTLLPERKIGSVILDEAWSIEKDLEFIKNIRIIQNNFYRYFYRNPKLFSLLDIKLNLKKYTGEDLSPEDIRISLKAFAGLEIIKDESYQWKFESLSSLADRAFRVMIDREEKKAVAIRDIQKEINHRFITSNSKKKCNIRSLINQMTIDERFEPVGKSGNWILSEWTELRVGLITQIMKDYFHVTKRKATSNMVYEYVKEKRPDASLKSVLIYLTQRDEFVQVTSNEFELAEWGSEPFAKRKLVRKASTRKTKRQIIQEHIKAFLMTQPRKRALVRDVFIHIKSKIEKLYDKTFYAYLESMEHVEKETIDNKLYCYLIRRDVMLFISYSRKDEKFVDALEVKLEEAGFSFFRDIHDLTSGPIEKQIQQEIGKRIVLLILSTNSANSDWVHLELEYARNAEKEQGRYVLCPVSLDNSWENSTQLPDRLKAQIKKYVVVDFSKWSDDVFFRKSFAKLEDGLHSWYN